MHRHALCCCFCSLGTENTELAMKLTAEAFLFNTGFHVKSDQPFLIWLLSFFFILFWNKLTLFFLFFFSCEACRLHMWLNVPTLADWGLSGHLNFHLSSFSLARVISDLKWSFFLNIKAYVDGNCSIIDKNILVVIIFICQIFITIKRVLTCQHNIRKH